MYWLIFLLICITGSHSELYSTLDVDNNHYEYHEIGASWSKAKAQCESRGATLFYPESADELEKMMDIVPEKNRLFEYLWVGMTRENGTFSRTITGKPIATVYNNWDKSEPNNAGGIENCVVLMDQQRTLNDYNCNALFKYICKFQGSPYESHRPLEQHQGLTAYSNSTQFLYKFHNEKALWSVAVSQCESEKGILYYPTSETDAMEVMMAFDSYDDGSYWLPWIWTGIKCGVSKCYTVDDQIFTNMSVLQSSEYEPLYPHYVTLRRDGLLDKAEDDLRYLRYICKIDKAIKPMYTPSSDIVMFHDVIYKFHNETTLWNHAAAQCQLEKGTLYYPTSEAEAIEVTMAFDSYQGGFDQPPWIWTGIRRDADKLVTIDNQTFSDMLVLRPYNYDPYFSYYVILHKNGLLSQSQDYGLPYICKIELQEALKPTLSYTSNYNHSQENKIARQKEYIYASTYSYIILGTLSAILVISLTANFILLRRRRSNTEEGK